MKKKDSLKINQNKDGSYTAEWDKNDPEWSFLNGLDLEGNTRNDRKHYEKLKQKEDDEVSFV